MRNLLFLLLLFYGLDFQLQAQPVGSWQEYLPYGSAIDLAASPTRLYAATPYSAFSLDGQDVFERYSRASGLSETGVKTIFSTPNGSLVIAYNNSSIDVMDKYGIHTINALQLKPVNGDKSIYQITGNDETCLLSTGFGIVVLNLLKYELGNSWVIGDNGVFVRVNATIEFDGNYYAATDSGLKMAALSSGNLADYRNWQMVSGTSGLPAGGVNHVFICGSSLYVQAQNILYRLENGHFQPVYTDSAKWLYAGGNADNLLVCEIVNGIGQVQVLGTDGLLVESIRDPLIKIPKKAMVFQNSVWIADSIHGLLEHNATGLTQSIPNSPAAPGSGDILANNRDWWMSTGSSISHFSNGQWTVYNADGQSLPAGFTQIGPLELDRSGSLWAGSRSGGLLQRKEDQFTIYKEGLLGAAFDDPVAYRVGGLASDRDNNLWITNPGAVNGLVVRQPDGKSTAFRIPFTYNSNTLSQVLIDDINQKWILASAGNGLFCFNHGQSLEDPGDDQWRKFTAGPGNGNLPNNAVNCIAKDAFGFIWIGTIDGIALVQCAEQVFSTPGCEAVWPVVQSGQFAGYLFKGENVQAIAVDGANRKWIGTRNGAWLISESGDKTLHQFNSANSPLLDNDVQEIAIDPVDGTVLFSTASGLCTYKGDATAGGERNNQVLVYPNPVPPGYNGQVAIRGLVNNALVKVTALNGQLIYQSRAAGGQLVWNGRDLNGRPISSGVYLVFISDDSRREQLVTKIVFIQR